MLLKSLYHSFRGCALPLSYLTASWLPRADSFLSPPGRPPWFLERIQQALMTPLHLKLSSVKALFKLDCNCQFLWLVDLSLLSTLALPALFPDCWPCWLRPMARLLATDLQRQLFPIDLSMNFPDLSIWRLLFELLNPLPSLQPPIPPTRVDLLPILNLLSYGIVTHSDSVPLIDTQSRTGTTSGFWLESWSRPPSR